MRALKVQVYDSQTGNTRNERYTRSPIRIGRHPSNDLCLSFGFVSGRHAQLEFNEQGGTFTDVGSTNGSTIDGRRVGTMESIAIYDGLSVTIGKLEMRFGWEEVSEPHGVQHLVESGAPMRTRSPRQPTQPIQAVSDADLRGPGTIRHVVEGEAPTGPPGLSDSQPPSLSDSQPPLGGPPSLGGGGPPPPLGGGPPPLGGGGPPPLGGGPPSLGGGGPPPPLGGGPPSLGGGGPPPSLGGGGPPPSLGGGGPPPSLGGGGAPPPLGGGPPPLGGGGPPPLGGGAPPPLGGGGPPPLGGGAPPPLGGGGPPSLGGGAPPPLGGSPPPLGGADPAPSLEVALEDPPRRPGAEATGFVDLSGVHRAIRELRPAYDALTAARDQFEGALSSSLEKLPKTTRETAQAFLRREFPDMPGATPFAPPAAPETAASVDANHALAGFASALMGEVEPPADEEEAAAFLARIQEILQTTAQAFVEIRNVQARFGEEMGVRTIREFTPLHAAGDARNVLEHLLDWRRGGPERNAQLSAVYSDFMLHQVALINGVVEGVQGMMDQFRPSEIERGIGGLNKSATAWKKYTERYVELVEDRGIAALVFGPEFARAYAEVGSG